MQASRFAVIADSYSEDSGQSTLSLGFELLAIERMTTAVAYCLRSLASSKLGRQRRRPHRGHRLGADCRCCKLVDSENLGGLGLIWWHCLLLAVKDWDPGDHILTKDSYRRQSWLEGGLKRCFRVLICWDHCLYCFESDRWLSDKSSHDDHS